MSLLKLHDMLINLFRQMYLSARGAGLTPQMQSVQSIEQVIIIGYGATNSIPVISEV